MGYLSEFNKLNVVNGDLLSSYASVMVLAHHVRGPSQGGARGLKAVPTYCACVATPSTERVQLLNTCSEQVLRADRFLFFLFSFFD